ncbi:MAG: hypothetical protein U0Q18_12185 [Bryobacteraceae bacterium]
MYAQSAFRVAATPSLHPSPFQNGLLRAAASGGADVWAVGQSTIHFDGTGWTAFPAPGIHGDNTSYLDGVAVFSPTNAWAAGLVHIGLANPGQVIEHWNGTQWNVFPGPSFNSGDQPAIYDMTGIAANDIWAVGSLLTGGNSLLEALFEHWDGAKWTAETGIFHGFFHAVSAAASNDIWAVGYNNNSTFSEHYNGTAWVHVPTLNVGSGPNSLQGVAALAPDDVWAVGWSTASQKPPPGQFQVPTKTLIEHFDGSAWSVVPSPNVGPNSQYQSNHLYGIVAVSPTDLWAFGSYFAASGSGVQSTLLLHWDGTSWTLAPCPNPRSGSLQSNILWGGVVTGPGVWIVGAEQIGLQTLALFGPGA